MKKLIRIGLCVAAITTMMSAPRADAQILFQRGGFDNSVVDVAIGVNAQNGEFSTLIAALSHAGLVEILDSFGPVTVFAPTDAAFAANGITASNVSSLPVSDVRAILLYHVAFGEFLSPDVLQASSVRSLIGAPLRPRYTDSGLFVVDATYTPARVLVMEELFDIQGDNGVIHVIDNVLRFR